MASTLLMELLPYAADRNTEINNISEKLSAKYGLLKADLLESR